MVSVFDHCSLFRLSRNLPKHFALGGAISGKWHERVADRADIHYLSRLPASRHLGAFSFGEHHHVHLRAASAEPDERLESIA